MYPWAHSPEVNFSILQQVGEADGCRAGPDVGVTGRAVETEQRLRAKGGAATTP